MDIKQRIQELSLDQKAKLYFMGLVRQGKIDTLPEDPKAAYVSMMMDKDDYGRSISGKDKRTFMEPEDSMPAARARKLAGMEDDPRATFTDDEIEDYYLSADLPELATELGYLNENQPTSISDKDLDDLRDIILKYVKDPDDAEAEVDRFDQGGFDAMSNMVTANLLRDPEYKKWYNNLHSIKEGDTYEKMAAKGKKAGNLKQGTVRKRLKIKAGDKIPLSKINQAISKIKKMDNPSEKNKKYLKALNLAKTLKTTTNVNEEENYQNLPKPDKINLSYTDPGFRFYGMYLYKDGNDRYFAKISYEDRATKYLKNLGVKTEVPRSFDTNILDKIEQEIEALGIKGDYDAAMDVS